jgi:hypothetical protein
MVTGFADDRGDMQPTPWRRSPDPIGVLRDRTALFSVARGAHRPRRNPAIAVLACQAQHPWAVSGHPHFRRAEVFTLQRQTDSAGRSGRHDAVIEERSQLAQQHFEICYRG